MSLLNAAFDVIRGWPDESTIEDTFVPDSGVSTALTEGDIVYLTGNAADAVDRATGTDLAGAVTANDGGADLALALVTLPQLWLVVSGNADNEYDGLKQGGGSDGSEYIADKLVAIRGHYQFETTNFDAGSYAVGEAVTANAGAVARIPTDNPGLRQFGEVRKEEDADGVLTITVGGAAG